MFWIAFKSGGTRTYYDFPCNFSIPNTFKSKTSILDEEYKLTDSDIESFYKEGYLGPFDLVPEEESKDLLDHMLNLIQNTESKCFSYARGDYEFAKKPDPDKIDESEKWVMERMNSFNRHLDDPWLQKLFKSKPITERCAQILGPDLILWQSVFFNIKPFQKGTRWHQASTFIMTDSVEPFVYPPKIDELFSITIWIALTDATIENGCIRLIPGSQKQIWPVRKEKLSKGVENSTYGSYQAEIEYPIESSEIRHIEVKAGQFFMFTERVIHGSTENQTNEGRWAINGRIVRTDTQVVSRTSSPGIRHFPMYGLRNLKLDNWKALLIRGRDQYNLNRLAKSSQ
jgi:chlorinating enzyme